MLVLEGFYARISGRACNRCSMSVVSHALALHSCSGIQLGCLNPLLQVEGTRAQDGGGFYAGNLCLDRKSEEMVGPCQLLPVSLRNFHVIRNGQGICPFLLRCFSSCS